MQRKGGNELEPIQAGIGKLPARNFLNETNPASHHFADLCYVSRSIRQVYGGSAEQLRGYSVNISPPEQIWVEVDKENGIWFKQVRGLL